MSNIVQAKDLIDEFIIIKGINENVKNILKNIKNYNKINLNDNFTIFKPEAHKELEDQDIKTIYYQKQNISKNTKTWFQNLKTQNDILQKIKEMLNKDKSINETLKELNLLFSDKITTQLFQTKLKEYVNTPQAFSPITKPQQRTDTIMHQPQKADTSINKKIDIPPKSDYNSQTIPDDIPNDVPDDFPDDVPLDAWEKPKKPDDKITHIRNKKKSLNQRQDIGYEEAQEEMSKITEEKTEVSKKSKYWEEIKVSKLANTIKENALQNQATILKLFENTTLNPIVSKFLDNNGDDNYDLSLCFLGSEGYIKTYQYDEENRVGRKTAKLWADTEGNLHTLISASEQSLNARGIVSISETLERMKTYKDKIKMNMDNINSDLINELAKKLLTLSSYHCCSLKTLESMIKSKGLKSLYKLQHPYKDLSKSDFIRTAWNETKISEEKYKSQQKKLNELIEDIIKNNKEFEMDLICAYYSEIYSKNFVFKIVKESIPIDSLKELGPELNSYKKDNLDQIKDKCDKKYNKLFEYFESILPKNDETLCQDWSKPDPVSGGLGATKDKQLLSHQTVFSIFGGNLKANTIYGDAKCKAIIKIPSRCLSYVTPYSEMFNANADALDLLGDNFPNNFQTNPGSFNGDNRAIDGIIMNPHYKGEFQEPKSNKLNINNEICRISLALNMYCQYAILTGKDPSDASVDKILSIYYEKVGSHACIEGHSPGNIPFGKGGVEEILIIGEKIDSKLLESLKAQNVKVAIINEIPRTYSDFENSWKLCKIYTTQQWPQFQPPQWPQQPQQQQSARPQQQQKLAPGRR